MTARTHDLAAITALGIVAVITQPLGLNFSTILIAILANQIGGITPDIDQPTAPFWRNLPIAGYFGKVVDRMLGGHRFITHSVLGIVLFGFLAQSLLHFLHPIMKSVYIPVVWWAFIIGMVSHLVMDTFTKEGVPWLLPIPIKFGIPPIRALRITTGKKAEAFLFLLLLACDILACWAFYPQLITIVQAKP